MSPGQMLPEQMSPWQLEFVLDVPRNLRLEFHQNRVSNSWDIADIELVWVVGGGVVCKLKFVSNPTFVMLGRGWVGVVIKFQISYSNITWWWWGLCKILFSWLMPQLTGITLPSTVVFDQRFSFIKGPLPIKAVFHQSSSSIKGHLPSKEVFH